MPCGLAAAGREMHFNSCTKRRIGLQKLEKSQLGGSSEQGPRRSSPDKRLLREVAETRGTSAKRLLNEEVPPQRSNSLIHPFIGSASDSLAHQLTI